MSKAVATADTAFQKFLEAERTKPVQRNLFTGDPEALRVEVPDQVPDDETVVDEGISLVKTEDMAQLIVSGFGLYRQEERTFGCSERQDDCLSVSILPDPGGGHRFERHLDFVGPDGGALCSRHSNQFLGRRGQALRTGVVSLFERNHSNASRSATRIQ